MVNIALYRPFIDQLEVLVKQLDKEFDRPEQVPFGQHFVFRHKPKARTYILASFLKLVKIVSLLNATFCLMEKGFAQEANGLCRGIDEAIEEITFLALKIGETGTSPKQNQMLEEFYQEQLADPSDPLSSIPRKRVSRNDIRAAIGNIPISSSDPHTRNRTTRALYEIISGFVHGAYVHIMEMYGGRFSRYHMRGMPGSPYMDDCADNFANYLYRAIVAVEIVASRVGRQDVLLAALGLGCSLGEATGCIDAETIKRLKDKILNFNTPPA